MADDVPPYTLTAPLDGASALILSSPHSGTHIPSDAIAHFTVPLSSLRRIEDAHVDRLVIPAATASHVPLIAATHARAVIDLNRAENEYDPAMIAGRMPLLPAITDRVRRGYGLVPRIAASTQPIHRGRLPAEVLQARLASLHRPWHRAIAAGMAAAHRRHGYALLIDCHSMPRLDPPQCADLVLGDGFGSCAHPSVSDAVAALFRQQGLRVIANRPYAGGHGTRHHGHPSHGLHAVQLEFCRSLYMHPATLATTDGFNPLATAIAATITALVALLPDLLGRPPLAQAAE